MMSIRLGTRGSKLALAQADFVSKLLEAQALNLEVQIIVIKTKGDQLLNDPIWKIGDKGLFVKELETALQNNEIDLAVHSAKDLPAVIADDLCLAAFPEREDPSDVLVAKESLTLNTLFPGAVVGTSALRRESQLRSARPDLEIKMLRGNVDTRLRKLDEGAYDAIVVAKAGLNRLGIKRGIAISPDVMLPSPAQGALGLQARKNDDRILEQLQLLNHPPTSVCVNAERSFLAGMEGGCQLPIGALAHLLNDHLTIEGYLGSPDGKQTVRHKLQGNPDEANEIGMKLADLLKTEGKSILKALK